MSPCRCERVSYVIEGERVEGIVRHDSDCPQHGRGDEWKAGDPLRRYARVTETGLETPREVEARLLKEARG